MPLTDAQRRAMKKYHAKFDELKVRFPAGEGDAIREHAARRGESVNEFLIRAVEETVKRDNAEGGGAAHDKRPL